MTTQQVCIGCGGTDITYAAFSGGREYYCPTCDSNFAYDPETRPRRLSMLAEGRYDELRAEMRDELERRQR